MHRRVIGLIVLIVPLIVCSFAAAQPTVCARVGVQLSQDAIISRDAFRGILTMTNESADALSGIGVTIDIRDPQGQPANDRFSIELQPLTTPLTGVDGTGVLPGASSGSAEWVFVPSNNAAPDGPVVYGFGGSLTYTTPQGTLEVPLQPVYLTVFPNPALTIRYFWERDVYADDPLTLDQVEPQRPFAVAMLLSNTGAGTARNVRFNSSQPRITRNDRGLLIEFLLLGTQVDCNPISPALEFNFGDITPGDTRSARWLMSSTLSGHFEDFRVTMEHVDALGDRRLTLSGRDSLFGVPTIHELIRSVRSQESEADCKPDFLVSDLGAPGQPADPYEDPNNPERVHLPDRVYLSDGTDEPVIPVFDGQVTPTNQLRATVTATPPPDTFFYLKVPDPSESTLQVVRVLRGDGRELEIGSNVWQTDRVFRDNDLEPLRLNRLHIFDKGGPGTYTVFYENLGAAPSVEKWESLASHGSLGEAAITMFPLPVEYSEPRQNGLQKLRMRFNRPVSAASFAPGAFAITGYDLNDEPIDLSSVSWTTSLSFDQREGTIEFTSPLPDRARYCLRMVGVSDPFGNVFVSNTRIVFTVLSADATGDRRINNTDVGAVLSLNPTATIALDNAQHLRADINRDGRIDDSDVAAALAGRRTDAAYIPDPCGDPIRGGPDGDDLDGVIAAGPPNGVKKPRIGGPVTANPPAIPPIPLGIRDGDPGSRNRGSDTEELPADVESAAPESLLAIRWSDENPPEQLGSITGFDTVAASPPGWRLILPTSGIAPRDVAVELARYGIFSTPVVSAADGSRPVEAALRITGNDATSLSYRESLPGRWVIVSDTERILHLPASHGYLVADLRSELRQRHPDLTIHFARSEASPCRRGDLNCDGQVDAVDAKLLMEAIGTPRPGAGFYDINLDGVVDGEDLVVLVDRVR